MKLSKGDSCFKTGWQKIKTRKEIGHSHISLFFFNNKSDIDYVTKWSIPWDDNHRATISQKLRSYFALALNSPAHDIILFTAFSNPLPYGDCESITAFSSKHFGPTVSVFRPQWRQDLALIRIFRQTKFSAFSYTRRRRNFTSAFSFTWRSVPTTRIGANEG